MKLRTYFFLLFSFFLVTSAFAQVDKQQQLEEKRQALLNEIKQINSLLFATQKEEKSVLTQVEDLDSKINTRQNLIRVTNQQANLLSREINDNLGKIDHLRGELKELKEDYASMILKSYKSKSTQSRIMFVMSSEDFLQAYKRFQYMKQYTKHRKLQGESIKEKTIVLQELNKDLIVQKKQKQVLIEENKVAKTKLSSEKKDQEELIAILKKDEGKYARQIKKKQREASKIDKEIEKVIRDAIAASNAAANKAGATTTKKSSKKFALTAEAKALAADFTNNKGKLPWPVKNGVVVKRFGNTRHPQLPNVTTYCSGVEIATEKDSKARVVFNGVVLSIQKIKGANYAIHIQHGNYITVYSNMVNILVKKGDKVTTKQEIGTVYTRSNGKTILKFLVYKNTTKMNPASWVYRM